MSELAVVITPLNPTEARSLTDEAKRNAEALWTLLLDLYEREAHLALDYTDWGDYFTSEFGQSRRQGYYLIDAAQVKQILPVQHVALNARQAAELAPLLRKATPEVVREVYAEAVEEAGSAEGVTAAQLRSKVQEILPPKTSPIRGPQPTPQYLTDVVAPDSSENVRTEVARWFELGRHIQRLLADGATLQSKSPEDRASIQADADLMPQIAKAIRKGVK